jgi:hypothetical protein
MKKILTLIAFFALAATTTEAQTWATTENYKTAQAVGSDIRAKRYTKATERVLTHREIKRRTKMNDRELALVKDPRRSWAEVKRDPLTFAEKHKSSFWDRFRKGKKTKGPTRKK